MSIDSQGITNELEPLLPYVHACSTQQSIEASPGSILIVVAQIHSLLTQERVFVARSQEEPGLSILHVLYKAGACNESAEHMLHDTSIPLPHPQQLLQGPRDGEDGQQGGDASCCPTLPHGLPGREVLLSRRQLPRKCHWYGTCHLAVTAAAG